MTKCTISQALRKMQSLTFADAGRLVGVDPTADAWRIPAAAAGTPGWSTPLTELLAGGTTGAVAQAAPAYLVLSDEFPVCWLTADGVVVTAPDAGLSRTQLKHRKAATDALGDLHRYTLSRLADRRDARDGRHSDTDDAYTPDRIGSLRVANPTEPARAWWVPITGDLDASQRRVADATGTDQPLIITACGYGGYARDAHRLRLDVLCGLHRAAAAHNLPPGVVGDWLTEDGGPAELPNTQPLSADDILAAFADAYLGRFSHRHAYTAHRMVELGWEQALREMGATEFFDTRAFEHHLFSYEVIALTVDDYHGDVVVCRQRRAS